MNWRGLLEAAPDGLRRLEVSEVTADLFAFFLTVICAAAFDWRATGLVWGLWLSSLTFGYTFIVLAIFRGALVKGGDHAAPEMTKRLAAGIPLLLFFTFHFGMFHFVHGAFLTQFFPRDGVSGFGFPTPWGMFSGALAAYWPMVVATFLSRYKDLPLGQISKEQKGSMMVGPYVNVVRMHLLIFVFAGLNAVGASGLAIYPVLFFYFFPWKVFFYRGKGAEASA